MSRLAAAKSHEHELEQGGKVNNYLSIIDISSASHLPPTSATRCAVKTKPNKVGSLSPPVDVRTSSLSYGDVPVSLWTLLGQSGPKEKPKPISIVCSLSSTIIKIYRKWTTIRTTMAGRRQHCRVRRLSPPWTWEIRPYHYHTMRFPCVLTRTHKCLT